MLPLLRKLACPPGAGLGNFANSGGKRGPGVRRGCVFAATALPIPGRGIIGNPGEVAGDGVGMIDKKKICVVLPACNTGRTLERTLREIPMDVVDDIILVDDFSTDDTVEVARRHSICVRRHDRNKGYGGNQKTCYRLTLERGADIVIMLHPDYQYSPKLLLPMASLLGSGFFDVVLGSRILGVGALAGGMPLYKYISNRVLTLIQNLLVGHKLSE
jgi:glycosyltransferase involved in cell wall biosynthesis